MRLSWTKCLALWCWLVVVCIPWYGACIKVVVDHPENYRLGQLEGIYWRVVLFGQIGALLCSLAMNWADQLGGKNALLGLLTAVLVFCIPGDVAIHLIEPFGPVWTLTGTMAMLLGYLPYLAVVFIGEEVDSMPITSSVAFFKSSMSLSTRTACRVNWSVATTLACLDNFSDIAVGLGYILEVGQWELGGVILALSLGDSLGFFLAVLFPWKSILLARIEALTSCFDVALAIFTVLGLLTHDMSNDARIVSVISLCASLLSSAFKVWQFRDLSRRSKHKIRPIDSSLPNKNFISSPG